MTHLTTLVAGAALAGIAAVPAAAQYYPQQSYPQTYPNQQTYPQQYPQNYQGYQQPYGYGQNYGQTYGQGYTGNPVTDIIDQLLGNRYSVTDRQAVRRCAQAAMAQAASQYGGGYGGYGGYGNYNNSYNRGGFRVTSISDVQRRSNGLRVSGLMSGSGGAYGNQAYGYGNRGYGGQGYGTQLSFRCNVDYNGSVTGVRVRAAGQYRGY